MEWLASALPPLLPLSEEFSASIRGSQDHFSLYLFSTEGSKEGKRWVSLAGPVGLMPPL